MLLWLAPAAGGVAAPAAAGEPIGHKDGIETFRRSRGDGLLQFLGRGEVAAEPLRIIAALIDEGHATQWVHHCVQAQMLDHPAALRWVTYRRNAAGAPLVADRDMVLSVVLSQPTDARWVLSFARLADDRAWPPPPGVVRVGAIVGQFTVSVAGPANCLVAYEVAVDPGGQLPAWLTRRATAELPRQTLVGLRRAVLAEHLPALAAAVAAELAAVAASGRQDLAPTP